METELLTAQARSEPLRPLIFGFVTIVLLMAVAALAIFAAFDTWDKRGQFGDMFGGINSLFSGLAFAALAYAQHLQRRELSLQREELALTRAELAKQSEAQTSQAATALMASQINGLGALYQGYSAAWSANRHQHVAEEPVREMREVQARLKQLLLDAERAQR